MADRPDASQASSTAAPDPQADLAVGKRRERSRLWLPVRIVGVPVVVLFRVVCAALWVVLGLWTALMIYFNAPTFDSAPGTLPRSRWPGLLLAVLVGVVFLVAMRERVIDKWRFQSWRRWRCSLAALGLVLTVIALMAVFRRPDPGWVWSREQAHSPVTVFEGDLAHITNVRDFGWRSDGSIEAERWETRTYDLSKLTTMYYVVVPLGSFDGAAHVFVCFGFSDGASLAVSVEGRRRLGDSYRVVPSMFRQYQLVYVVGEERDVVGVRGAIWKAPVRFYPARARADVPRAVLTSMLRHSNTLGREPEYYHLIFNNCLTNITSHLRELGTPLPRDLALIMTGLSDRVAYNLGYLDTELPFDQAREVFRIDGWMRDVPLDETFSARLRDHLRERAGFVEGKWLGNGR